MEYKLKGGLPGVPQVPPAMPMFLMLIGGGLVFLGALLFVNEQLLRYLVSGMFVVVGLLLALVGYRARRLVG